MYSTEMKDWPDAEADCKMQSINEGGLAEPREAKIAEFISSMLPPNNYYRILK